MILRLQRKKEIRKATKRNQNSLYNAINVSQSLISRKALWIHNLLALAKDAEQGWFNGILEDILRMLSSRLTLVDFYASVLIPSSLQLGLAWVLCQSTRQFLRLLQVLVLCLLRRIMGHFAKLGGNIGDLPHPRTEEENRLNVVNESDLSLPT